jgi:hypothetical protein
VQKGSAWNGCGAIPQEVERFGSYRRSFDRDELVSFMTCGQLDPLAITSRRMLL